MKDLGEEAQPTPSWLTHEDAKYRAATGDSYGFVFQVAYMESGVNEDTQQQRIATHVLLIHKILQLSEVAFGLKRYVTTNTWVRKPVQVVLLHMLR